MKLFMQHEIREATTYAIQGGDALHLHRMLVPGCPACFRNIDLCGRPLREILAEMGEDLEEYRR